MVLHNYIRMQAFVVDIVANTHTHTEKIKFVQIRFPEEPVSRVVLPLTEVQMETNGLLFKKKSFSKTGGVLVEGC